MTVLVIAPHADDEVLGCGGVINKYSQEGNKVIVLIATNASIGAPELYKQSGIDNVRNEAKESHKVLGVHKTEFLEFPAPKLDVYPIYQMANEISEVIKKYEPEILLIPHRGDIHKDHTRIFDAALVAARPINGCSVKKIMSYETLSETEWARPDGDAYFIPNVYISIENNLENKIEALKQFKSQIREFPHSRSIEALKSLAKYRGATVGYKAAEAFKLIREIL
ncbi:PIG-L deacetylase family protein [Marinifilum fragile]|uniref:PIG-L deacetylase family protein n=1 Tax=Marinifilum fragile TaxID=570161 RepID=UPI002AA7EB32|nr:PIG-L deacetylase family protein [Marinifilum fragile]